jgi:hypothetical protein
MPLLAEFGCSVTGVAGIALLIFVIGAVVLGFLIWLSDFREESD